MPEPVETFNEIKNSDETVEVNKKAVEHLVAKLSESYPQNAIDRKAISLVSNEL